MILTQKDQEDILHLIEFLKVFKEETDNLQREIDPSAHLVLLSCCRLLKHCANRENDNSAIRKLKIKVEQHLKDKFKPSLKQKIATFLWPPFKHLKMLPNVEREEVR